MLVRLSYTQFDCWIIFAKSANKMKANNDFRSHCMYTCWITVGCSHRRISRKIPRQYFDQGEGPCSPGNFQFFPEVQNGPTLWCGVEVQLLQVGVQFSGEPIAYKTSIAFFVFCTSFLRWIAVNYYSNRQLRAIGENSRSGYVHVM